MDSKLSKNQLLQKRKDVSNKIDMKLDNAGWKISYTLANIQGKLEEKMDNLTEAFKENLEE